jgi:uncharacterized membrane protein (TIGR02234 family)
MSTRVQFLLALALDVVGTATVLLVATRDWQTIDTPRYAAYLPDDTLQVTGRTVDAAPTAMALVALAGAIAVIATRGMARRIIGAVVAVAGLGIVWRGISATTALSVSRARDLVRDQHPTAASTTAVPHVSTHNGWAVLTVAGAVLVVVAGVLVAMFGARWTSMSARYETPAAQEDPDARTAERARADAAMWTALDRGDDPTERDPRDTE